MVEERAHEQYVVNIEIALLQIARQLGRSINVNRDDMASWNAGFPQSPFGDAAGHFVEIGSNHDQRVTVRHFLRQGALGAHNFFRAQHLIDCGRVGYIQVTPGRMGGIGPAKRGADYATGKGVTFVNHTFTSHLALSASLQPYAGLHDEICEYPFAPKPLARELTVNHLERDKNGNVSIPDAPGLGVSLDKSAASHYFVDVEIRARGQVLFASSQKSL